MRTAAILQEPAGTVRSFGLPQTASLEGLAACFGVACPVHGQCARYAAVNRSQADPGTIATCQSGTTFPRFVKIDIEKQLPRAG
jgi:hypothetical protein